MPHHNNPSPLAWKKPTRSGTGPDSNCVEVAKIDTTVAIRDTKIATGTYPVLTIPNSDWTALLTSVAS